MFSLPVAIRGQRVARKALSRRSPPRGGGGRHTGRGGAEYKPALKDSSVTACSERSAYAKSLLPVFHQRGTAQLSLQREQSSSFAYRLEETEEDRRHFSPSAWKREEARASFHSLCVRGDGLENSLSSQPFFHQSPVSNIHQKQLRGTAVQRNRALTTSIGAPTSSAAYRRGRSTRLCRESRRRCEFFKECPLGKNEIRWEVARRKENEPYDRTLEKVLRERVRRDREDEEEGHSSLFPSRLFIPLTAYKDDSNSLSNKHSPLLFVNVPSVFWSDVNHTKILFHSPCCFRCYRGSRLPPAYTAGRHRSQWWARDRVVSPSGSRPGHQEEEEGSRTVSSTVLLSAPSQGSAREEKAFPLGARIGNSGVSLGDPSRCSSSYRSSSVSSSWFKVGSSRSLSTTTAPATASAQQPSFSPCAPLSSPSSFSCCPTPSSTSSCPFSPSSASVSSPQCTGRPDGDASDGKKRERLLSSVLQSVSGLFPSQTEHGEVVEMASSLLHAPLHEVEAFMLRELVPFVSRSHEGNPPSPSSLYETEELRIRQGRMRTVACAVAAVLRSRSDGLCSQLLEHKSLFWVVFLPRLRDGLLPLACILLSEDVEASVFSSLSEMSFRKRCRSLPSSEKNSSSFRATALRPSLARRTVPRTQPPASSIPHASPSAVVLAHSCSRSPLEHASPLYSSVRPSLEADHKSAALAATRTVCLEVRYRATVLTGLLSLHSQQSNLLNRQPLLRILTEQRFSFPDVAPPSNEEKGPRSSERLERLEYSGDDDECTRKTPRESSEEWTEERESFLRYVASQASLLVTQNLPLVAKGAELLEQTTSVHLRQIAEFNRARASGLATERSRTTSRWSGPVIRDNTGRREVGSSATIASKSPLTASRECQDRSSSVEGSNSRSHRAVPAPEADMQKDVEDYVEEKGSERNMDWERKGCSDFLESLQESLQILGQAALDHADAMRLVTLLARRLSQEYVKTRDLLSITSDEKMNTEAERLSKKKSTAKELHGSLKTRNLGHLEWGESKDDVISSAKADRPVVEDTAVEKGVLVPSPGGSEGTAQATHIAVRAAARELIGGVSAYGEAVWRLAVTACVPPCSKAAEGLLRLLDDAAYGGNDTTSPVLRRHESRPVAIPGYDEVIRKQTAKESATDVRRRLAEEKLSSGQRSLLNAKDEDRDRLSQIIREHERVKRPPRWIRQASGRSRVMAAIVRDLWNNLGAVVHTTNARDLSDPAFAVLGRIQSLRELLSLLAASTTDIGTSYSLRLRQLLSSILWPDMASSHLTHSAERIYPQTVKLSEPPTSRMGGLPDTLPCHQGLWELRTSLDVTTLESEWVEAQRLEFSTVKGPSESNESTSENTPDVLGDSRTSGHELDQEPVVIRQDRRATVEKEERHRNAQVEADTEGSELEKYGELTSSTADAFQDSEEEGEGDVPLPTLHDTLERRGAYGLLPLLWPSAPLSENILGFTAMAIEEKERQFQFVVERNLLPSSVGETGANISCRSLSERTGRYSNGDIHSAHLPQEAYPWFLEKRIIQVDPHSGFLIPSFVLEKRRRVQLARREQRLAAEELTGINNKCLGLTVADCIKKDKSRRSAYPTRHVWWVHEGLVRGSRHAVETSTLHNPENANRGAVPDEAGRTRERQDLGPVSGSPSTQVEGGTADMTEHSALLEPDDDENSLDVFSEARLVELEQMTKESLAELLVLFHASTKGSICEVERSSESAEEAAADTGGRQAPVKGHQDPFSLVRENSNQAKSDRETVALFCHHIRRVAEILRAWDLLGPLVVSSVTVSTPGCPPGGYGLSQGQHREDDRMWGNVLCNFPVLDQELTHTEAAPKLIKTQASGSALDGAPCCHITGHTPLSPRCQGAVIDEARTAQRSLARLTHGTGVRDSKLSSGIGAIANLGKGDRDSPVMSAKELAIPTELLHTAAQSLYRVERRRYAGQPKDESGSHSDALLKLLTELQCVVENLVEALERESLKQGDLLPQVVTVRAAQSVLESFVFSLQCLRTGVNRAKRSRPPLTPLQQSSLPSPAELRQPSCQDVELTEAEQGSKRGFQAKRKSAWPAPRRVPHARATATYGAFGWGWEWLSFICSGGARHHDGRSRQVRRDDEKGPPSVDLASCSASGPPALLFLVPPRPRKITVSNDPRPLSDAILPTAGGMAVMLSRASTEARNLRKIRKHMKDLTWELQTRNPTSSLWLHSMDKLHGLLSYTVRPPRNSPPSP
ncbi:hypothetical protein CSUI_006432 [Cystoisospora suis]|uniref:Uncharacterized protein n=1 Tax=Cystoisospora suis TaxID=483139 RepID=A0A2C6KQA7_9APIC|nr:hypothetical protein CSUI_006432 [Cystoisospora suis]